MEVILLEKVDNLGNIGDRVKVKSGYGRNFLLPKGKATLATAENVAIVEARRAEFESKHADELAAAGSRGDKIRALKLQIKAKSGVEGKLFGSVGTIDIVEAFAKVDVSVERSEVRLPDGPIRMIGEHEIEIHLHSDVNVTVLVEVVSDGEPEIIPDFDNDSDVAADAETDEPPID